MHEKSKWVQQDKENNFSVSTVGWELNQGFHVLVKVKIIARSFGTFGIFSVLLGLKNELNHFTHFVDHLLKNIL